MSKTQMKKNSEIQKLSWKAIEKENLSEHLTRQAVFGEKATVAQFFASKGGGVARHSHVNEEYSLITSGALKYIFDDREVVVNAGDVVVIPANVPHSIVVLEDSVFVDFFAPAREDWLRGEDQYLRG
jgi:quercetin dioxygenase-like cupin family protein